MKLRDLEHHLTEQGCYFEREGGNHTLWKNPIIGKVAPVLDIAKSKRELFGQSVNN